MIRPFYIIAITLLLAIASLAPVTAEVTLKSKTVTLPSGDSNIKVSYPHFDGTGAVTKAANADLEKFARGRLQAYQKEVKQMKTEAKGTSASMRYSYSLKPTTSIARPNLISLYFTEETYTGGAHGMTYFYGRNYGLIKGRSKLLTLQDLFKPNTNAKKLAGEKVYAQLKTNADATWVKEGRVKATSPELTKQFIITPTGFMFLIEPYAVGPYSAGPFLVRVPFTEFGKALAYQATACEGDVCHF